MDMNRSASKILFLVLIAIAALSLSTPSRASRVQPIHITPVSDVPKKEMYFQSMAGEEELLAFRRVLLDRGAAHVHCFLPDLIVCDLPVDVDVHRLVAGTRILPYEPSSVRPSRQALMSDRNSLR